MNYSLVGLTPDQAKTFKSTADDQRIPSVDADIDACNVMLGDERHRAGGSFDKKLTETVVRGFRTCTRTPTTS